MKKKVLITGGSGLIGKKLTELLQSNGYSVSILSRKGGNFGGLETFQWKPESGTVDEEAFEDLEAIIHLAGSGIADKKWTRERKKDIIESRVKSAALIFGKIQSMPVNRRPKAFISASGIGYYGYDTGSVLITEKSRFGDDFLATVCKEWELAADAFKELSMRVVKLRTGFVMSGNGGALPAMMRPVRFGLGAGLGRGDQYLSWIHIDDLARMFMEVMENTEMHGVYNAVGPAPVTNKEMMKAIAKTIGKPFFLPNVPSFVLKLVLGEMASMVTGGNNVSSEKIESQGFKFNYRDLGMALENLLKG